MLAAAEGGHNGLIAERLGIFRGTVGKWRERFARLRLDGLYDEPRPGAPRQIGDDEIADTIRRTLETRPAGRTHWSLRRMAAAVGHAPSTIHRIWKAYGLQPHRSETFKLSNDPLFVEKVRDIVGLYLDPPDRAVVLCVDEKSQIQALDRTQEIKYANTPMYGINIKTIIQIALPQPEMSWRRNRSRATEMSSQNHMMKTNIVSTSIKKFR